MKISPAQPNMDFAPCASVFQLLESLSDMGIVHSAQTNCVQELVGVIAPNVATMTRVHMRRYCRIR